MKSERGFSLAELLIYVAVLATISGLLTGILYNSVRITNREGSSNEVVQQLNQVMGTIQKLVGDSSLIEGVYKTDGDTDPTNDLGSSSLEEFVVANECDDAATFCTLRLRFKDDSVDPSWVVASSDGIYLVRGDDGETDSNPDNETSTLLTTDAVNVDYLRFTKYELAGGHASTEVDISLTYNTGNPQFEITRTLTSAIGRVTAATFDDDLLPNTDSEHNIGSSNNKWQDGYFSRNVVVSSTLTVGTGTTPSAGLLEVATSTGTAGISLFEQANASLDAYDLQLKKARGTIGSPSVISSGDELGTVLFRGYSGAGGYVTGAAVKAISEGTIGTTRIPAHLSFWTGTDAAPTVLTERMRIDKAGNIGIGTTTPAYKLEIVGNLKATDFYSGDGTQGMTGPCGAATTITVKDGLITGCS